MSSEQSTSSIPAALIRRAYEHRLEHLAAAAALDVSRWEVHGLLVERLASTEVVEAESVLERHLHTTELLIANVLASLARLVRHAETLG